MNINGLFSNVNVFYLILLVLVIWMLPYYVGSLAGSQDDWHKKLEKVDDMHKHTAEYFGDFQSTFQTYPLGMLAGGMCAIAMIFIVVGVKVSAPNIKFTEIAPILVLIAFLMGFISAYKISNCMLGRMCGGLPCINPYFSHLSPSPS